MIEDMYNKIVAIKREKMTSDGMGGMNKEYQNHIASYKCRIYESKGRLVQKETGEQVSSTHKLAGGLADLVEGDKVIDGSVEYIILLVYTATDKQNSHHLEVNMKRLV